MTHCDSLRLPRLFLMFMRLSYLYTSVSFHLITFVCLLGGILTQGLKFTIPFGLGNLNLPCQRCFAS